MPFALPINTSYRDQLITGLLLGGWLYLFLAIIGPFDAAPLPLSIRMLLMIGYGLVFCAVYILCIPAQNWLYRRTGHWNILSEGGFLLLFILLCLPASYTYYITDWVNGDWGFPRFVLEIYLPTIVILLPAIIIARRFAAKKQAAAEATWSTLSVIQLSGSNKHDVLRLPPDHLIALSAADNYVNVFYLEADQLQKKLIRSPLKKLQEELPFLVQVHRSHLVNPIHFKEWRDTSTLGLTHIDIPISKTYKSRLLADGTFAPK